MSQIIFQYKFLETVSPLVCLQLLFYITVSMIVLFLSILFLLTCEQRDKSWMWCHCVGGDFFFLFLQLSL